MKRNKRRKRGSAAEVAQWPHWEMPQLFLCIIKALHRLLGQHLVQWVLHLGVNLNHLQNFLKHRIS